MSALDQLFNPLRARIGPYTLFQLRFIFRTAFTAFSGCVATTLTRTVSAQQAQATLDGRSGGRWRGRVMVHTGFWGCGSFGGNRGVMAYLQMIVIHYAGEEEGKDVEKALGWVKEDLGLEKRRSGVFEVDVEMLLRKMQERKEMWEEAN
ncbi:hypothetical protein BC829DRAFT_407876 [Chytridium lagenaria]|nr:hypothetical protein BC829DRAFT_407876 [Chytridium lagenaria]